MNWVADLQRNLVARELDPGPIDGVRGPRTFAALFGFMGAADSAATFGAVAAGHFAFFDITLPLRIAHFMAQATAETGGFRWLKELWGPTAAQLGYEGRSDLSNTQPGDGFRFRGRGIFQITGRDNYERMGGIIGLDLVANPDLAADPATALHIACLYWDQHKLNLYADEDNVLAVSNGINRGNPASIREPNGFDARKAALAKIKQVLPC